VSLGNHAAVRVVAGQATALAHAPVAGALLAHFPVRSREQIAKKALIGWLAHRLTQPERFVGDINAPGAPAAHWRRIFSLLASQGDRADADVMRDAIAAYAGMPEGAFVEDGELVDDPLGAAYELRYTEEAAPAPLSAIASWTDRLVSDINAGTLFRPR
jgi:hypothetical protein